MKKMKRPKKSEGFTEGDVAVVDEPFPIEEELIHIQVEPIEPLPGYKIVIKHKECDLEKTASEMLHKGWSLVGGANFSDKLGAWYQTFIKI